MFKKWCKSEMCWIDLKCLSIFTYKKKKCLSTFCGWDLNYANCLRTCHVETYYVLWNYVLNLRTCHVEIVYVLWRNYDFNDFKVFDKMLDWLVLRERDSIIAWYSSETYTWRTEHRACSIEHTYNSSTTVTERSKHS
jgi:hypothetical protein